MNTRERKARIGFGVANVAVAVFVAFGVFRLLPTRWWVVDTGAVFVALLLGSSGLALLARHPVAERLTRVAAGIVLALGLALFGAIALTASWISGVYSQVGTAGAIVFGLVAALVLPYVVVLPAVELAWLGPRAQPGAKDEPSKDVEVKSPGEEAKPAPVAKKDKKRRR